MKYKKERDVTGLVPKAQFSLPKRLAETKFTYALDSLPQGVGILHAIVPTFARSTPANCLIAVKTRMFAQPRNTPTPAAYKALWWVFEEYSGTLMPAYASCKLRRLSFEDWLAGFPPNRRNDFRKALQQYKEGKTDVRTAGTFNMIVKREFASNGTFPRFSRQRAGEECLADPEAFEAANPRAIMAPHDLGHVFCGPYLRPATRVLKKCFPKSSHLHYSGGDTPAELNSWFRRLDAVVGLVFMECDFSMFDQTIGALALDTEHQWLTKLGFPQDGPVAAVFKAWRRPTGRTRCGIKFTAPYMNASGRDDTALLNGLLNTQVQFFCLAQLLLGTDSAPLDLQGMAKLQLADLCWALELMWLITLGDDSVAAIPKEYKCRLAFMPALIGQFGFEAKMAVKDRLDEVVFLGCRPWRTNLGLTLGPTLGRRLYKHHWCMKPDAAPHTWLKGVAEAEMRAYPFVPVLSQINSRVLEMLQDVAGVEAARLSGSLSRMDIARAKQSSQAKACLATYEQLERIYGITAFDVALLTQTLSHAYKLPVILTNLKIDRVFEVDGM